MTEFIIINGVMIRRSLIDSVHLQPDGGVYVNLSTDSDSIRIPPAKTGDKPVWGQLVNLLLDNTQEEK